MKSNNPIVENPQSSESLDSRALDARVAELVMGYVWKTCPGYDFPLLYRPDAEIDPDDWGFFDLLNDPHPGVPEFSTTWDGFGAIYIRLREMGYGLTVYGHPSDLPNIQVHNRNYSRYVAERTLGVSAEELSRAASIAAIRAIEGAA